MLVRIFTHFNCKSIADAFISMAMHSFVHADGPEIANEAIKNRTEKIE